MPDPLFSEERSILIFFNFFFFNDPATTEIYTLSLHDALPIYAIGLVAPENPYPVEPYSGGFTSFMQVTTLDNEHKIGRAHV